MAVTSVFARFNLKDGTTFMPAPLSHLKSLESEAIEIFREVAASFEKPVMMYSIGKDSSVLLHLARKAFYPSRIPFPLLHIDTTWKFREMIEFRDRVAKEHGFELIVHTNPQGLCRQVASIRSIMARRATPTS